LKELDFDNSLGKIPLEAYPQQRLSLVQQGAEILRKLDQLTPVQAPVTGLPTGRKTRSKPSWPPAASNFRQVSNRVISVRIVPGAAHYDRFCRVAASRPMNFQDNP